MIKRFIKDTGIYGLSNILSKGISIILVPFYTRVLTPDDYGIIDILAVFYAIVAVTVPLEITQAVAIFLSDDNYSENGDRYTNNKIIVSSTAFFLTLFCFSFFLILSLIFSGPVALILLDDNSKVNIYQVASIHMFLTGLFYFVQNQLRWLLRPVKVAIVSITYTILSIALTIYFILISNFGVIGVFWAYVISAFIGFILGFYYSRDCYKFVFSFRKLKDMLKFSYPLVPSSVGVFFLNYTQRIIIKGIMTLGDLGLFGIASRLSSFINLAFQSIQGALIPLIYQRYKEKTTPESLRKMFNYLSFILFSCFIAISFFAKEIMILLTTPVFYSAYILVPFLFISEIFEGMKSFAVGLAIKKKTKTIALINLIGGTFTVGLSFLLIYLWGLLGAAIAISIKSISLFILQMIYSQKEYHVSYDFKKIVIACILAIVLIFVVYISGSIKYIQFIKVVVIILYILSLIYFLKLVSFSEMRVFLINRLKKR